MSTDFVSGSAPTVFSVFRNSLRNPKYYIDEISNVNSGLANNTKISIIRAFFACSKSSATKYAKDSIIDMVAKTKSK